MFEFTEINNEETYENGKITFNNIENMIFNKCIFEHIVFNNWVLS